VRRQLTLEGGNGEGRKQLQPDDGGTRPWAVENAGSFGGMLVAAFIQRWILHFVNFVIAFFSSCSMFNRYFKKSRDVCPFSLSCCPRWIQ
jgi:hypothetical protein